jgi:hypothetical protein
MDYQLWRWVAVADRDRVGYGLGQLTVADSSDAVSWLMAHVPRGPALERMLELYAGRVTNYWDYLRQWRERNQKDDTDDDDAAEAVPGDEVQHNS